MFCRRFCTIIAYYCTVLMTLSYVYFVVINIHKSQWNHLCDVKSHETFLQVSLISNQIYDVFFKILFSLSSMHFIHCFLGWKISFV